MSVDYKRRLFPNRLKVIRQNAGYTQQQVAALLGFKKSSLLSIWESEAAMPNGSNLIKLCILYNKTPQELYPEYCQQIADYFIGL